MLLQKCLKDVTSYMIPLRILSKAQGGKGCNIRLLLTTQQFAFPPYSSPLSPLLSVLVPIFSLVLFSGCIMLKSFSANRILEFHSQLSCRAGKWPWTSHLHHHSPSSRWKENAAHSTGSLGHSKGNIPEGSTHWEISYIDSVVQWTVIKHLFVLVIF